MRLLAALVAPLLLGAGDGREVQLAEVRRAHYVMGTIFEITAFGEDRARVGRAVEQAFARIRQSDEVLSHYRPDSALSLMNRMAADGGVEVPAELDRLLKESIRLSVLSDGAFDVTTGGLVALWGRCGEENRLPTTEEIRRGRQALGSGVVQLNGHRRVQFGHPGVAVNFGAIGKGWAVDRAVAALRAGGVNHALVSAGTSTLYALGSNGRGQGWLVAVRDPEGGEAPVKEFRLRDQAISTSAGYERFIEVGGKRYSHILDPRSGWPVEGMLSATVLAPTATEADALSTAAYVLGAGEGGTLLERLGREGFLIAR